MHLPESFYSWCNISRGDYIPANSVNVEELGFRDMAIEGDFLTLGFHDMAIEGNSLTIIEKIKSKSEDKSSIATIVEEIKKEGHKDLNDLLTILSEGRRTTRRML